MGVLWVLSIGLGFGSAFDMRQFQFTFLFGNSYAQNSD